MPAPSTSNAAFLQSAIIEAWECNTPGDEIVVVVMSKTVCWGIFKHDAYRLAPGDMPASLYECPDGSLLALTDDGQTIIATISQGSRA